MTGVSRLMHGHRAAAAPARPCQLYRKNPFRDSRRPRAAGRIRAHVHATRRCRERSRRRELGRLAIHLRLRRPPQRAGERSRRKDSRPARARDQSHRVRRPAERAPAYRRLPNWPRHYGSRAGREERRRPTTASRHIPPHVESRSQHGEPRTCGRSRFQSHAEHPSQSTLKFRVLCGAWLMKSDMERLPTRCWRRSLKRPVASIRRLGCKKRGRSCFWPLAQFETQESFNSIGSVRGRTAWIGPA